MRVKGSMLTFMVRSPFFSDSCKKTFLSTLHQSLPLSWVIRQLYKKVRSTGSVKRQKESETRAIRTGIQQLFNKLFNSKLTRKQKPWIMVMPTLKLLKNYWMPVRNALDFRFLFVFWQMWCSESFCTIFVWPMMMEAFNVFFSGKSVYVSRRSMGIEPMTALTLLLVSELIHSAEWRD